MELSTPFLHLKFDPTTMQFVMDTNRINTSESKIVTIDSENYICNENTKTSTKNENEKSNSSYQQSKPNFMITKLFTFLFSLVVFCISTNTASAQTAEKLNVLSSKGNLVEDTSDTFISFSPVHLGGKTYVRWLVKNDKKDGIFIVERSDDGVDFEALGFKDRVGTQLTVNLFYSFVDEEPLAGTSLYRVMQVGRDNTYKYSSVVKVKNEANPNISSSSASETTPSK